MRCDAKIKVGSEKISFNKEATRWLGVWLDSELKFTSHINERVRRARTAKVQIKGLTKAYGLVPGLVRRIQLSVVQSTALYGAELWWKGQKNHERTIQQIINRQARSITGMYSSTPIHPLLCEAGLVPASVLLDHRQRVYTHRLLCLPDSHPTKEILPISLREGDRGFQPGELPENTLMWTESKWPASFGQWLAWQITIDHCIDPAKRVEPVKELDSCSLLSLDVVIKGKKEAMEEARKDKPGLVLWADGSKLDRGQTAAAVCWEDKSAAKWERSIFLGRNKEIFDAELWAISEALEIAKKLASPRTRLVTIFSDSQKALRAIALPRTSQENRYLRSLVYKKTEELQQIGHLTTFQWVPGHSGVIGNEKADLSARNS